MGNCRIALIGSKGMLGQDLQKNLRKRAVSFEGFDLPEFDVTNPQQIEKKLVDFDIIINSAAYTNVEKAESEPKTAYAVNSEAPGKLAEFARKNNQYLLHFSTDFVFNGCKETPYTEQDKTNPINIYGKSKLGGEEKIQNSRCEYCIIRIEWTYGQGGNNFVSKLLSKADNFGQINVVDDQVGSPTPTMLISQTICDLLEKKPKGLYHFACSGYASRYETAKFIAQQKDLNIEVKPCKTSDYPTAAERPLSSRFDCNKISRLLENEIPGWKKCLKTYLEQL
jgi:dTDP-4-dehydrorhamnose reductase